MAQQFNAIIASQTVHWRGTSSVDILSTTSALPPFRAITGSVYALTVVGGVSGTFGVHVLGSIGGTTYFIAGVTNVTAAGSKIMYPATYDSDGIANAPATDKAVTTVQLDQIVPPSKVVFQTTGAATEGFSASCTVSACIYGGH